MKVSILSLAFLAFVVQGVVSRQVFAGRCTSTRGQTVRCPVSGARYGANYEIRIVSDAYSDSCKKAKAGYSIEQSNGEVNIKVVGGCNGYFRIFSTNGGGGGSSWGWWTTWSSCDGSCQQKRTRMCNSGRDTDCNGKSSDTQSCTGGDCRRTVSQIPPGLNGPDCGKANGHNGFRIVGGYQAKECEFPWMAHLHNHVYQQACGSTILDKRHILTAGHCVEKDYTRKMQPPSHFSVYTGSSKSYSYNPNPVVYKVERITVPKDYVNLNTVQDDIAILRTTRDIKFDRCTRPICVANQSIQKAKNCLSLGWGQTSNSREIYAKILKWSTTKVESRTNCKKFYGRFMSEQAFCSAAGTAGICSGDSGGPLVCLGDDGKYYQYGVAALAKPKHCGTKMGMFTDVTFYLDWMRTSMR